jgi:exonuclease III
MAYILIEKFDIFLLQDIRSSFAGDNVISENFEVCHNCPCPTGGVAIVFHKGRFPSGSMSVRLADPHGRLIIGAIPLGEQGLTVANTYLPSNQVQTRGFFSQTLQRILNTRLSYGVIAGDWNMVEEGIDRAISRPIALSDKEGIMMLMDKLAPEAEMLVDRFRVAYPDHREYTHSNRACKETIEMGRTRIDLIYIRESWVPRSDEEELYNYVPAIPQTDNVSDFEDGRNNRTRSLEDQNEMHG